MKMSEEFKQSFAAARTQHAEGNFSAAEKVYLNLVNIDEIREEVLCALADLYIHSQRPIEAIEVFKSLVKEVPNRLQYYIRLAALLEGLGQLGTAIFHYQAFLQNQPGNATAYFNIATLLKKGKRYVEALEAYEQAIALGISGPEEVYSNMGVVYADMRQGEKARQMYERALELEPEYIQAMFNLAGLSEETGRREEASQLYEGILSLDPRHWESLARLAYAKKLSQDDKELIESLKLASEQAKDDVLGRESIYFALGKSFDDLEQYEDAFSAYYDGNKLGKLRNPGYQSRHVENEFNRLIETFSPDWIRAVSSTSTAEPVFICGMFRSGSTLLEQILSGHASITAGGELDYLQWLVAQRLTPFPDRVVNASEEELEKTGAEYLSLMQTMFPTAQCITNKQPDNFLYLGLIKILYPSAKIIYTYRNPLDNCLSINFQQLGGNLNYATDLEDTAHYYRQHKRLMAHWMQCFPENIFTVEYDELVASPEPVLRAVLDFLGLEWDEKCLEFQTSANPVKTASVWQVREGLHTKSSGRWRNYESFVQGIKDLLD